MGTRWSLSFSWRGGRRRGSQLVATVRTAGETSKCPGRRCSLSSGLSLKEVQDRRKPRGRFGGLGRREASPAPPSGPGGTARKRDGGSAHLKSSRPEGEVFCHPRPLATHKRLLRSVRDSSPRSGCGHGRSRRAGGGGGCRGFQPRAITPAPAHFLLATTASAACQ